MADVVFIAVICAFFALCVVYVRWCDRIVGADITEPNLAGGGRDLNDAAPASTVSASP